MSLVEEMKMDKTLFTVAGLTDESDEAAFWREQTPLARLAALELMRQVMYGYDPSVARLERLFEVARLENGSI